MNDDFGAGLFFGILFSTIIWLTVINVGTSPVNYSRGVHDGLHKTGYNIQVDTQTDLNGKVVNSDTTYVEID